MKTQFKTSLLLLMAVPLLFISCAKNDANEDASSTINENSLKTDLVYCGTPTTYQMVDYTQSMAPGTVIIGNDQSHLLIKYQITPPAGYFVYRTALYVGPAAGFNSNWGTLNGGGTGHFIPWDQTFPNLQYYSSFTNLTYKEYLLDLTNLPDCFVVVAHITLRTIVEPSPATEIYLWGKDNLKADGYYIQYCVKDCAEPSCNTAYAYGNDLSNCFLGILGANSNNWGWSNGPIAPGTTATWPIYAGAGQCNTDNGTLVGTLDVVYTSGGTATVTYNLTSGFGLNVTHLYVGNEILPRDKKGKFTTAPGQFPYRHPNLNGATTDTYNISGLSGNIYVAAHSEVCGYY